MSRNARFMIGALVAAASFLLLTAVVFFFSAGAWAWSKAGEVMNTDPAQVAAVGAQIAKFRAPDGYQPSYAVNVAGFQVVEYDPGDGHSHLYLVRAPKWLKLDQATFERRVEVQLGSRYERKARSKVVDTRIVHVDGEAVPFVVAEGLNADGEAYRSMTGMWQTAEGQVLLSIEEPLARWNQAEIDAFLAGVR